MFGFFKKKKEEVPQVEVKEVTLYAPANGQLINIEEVNDVVFAQKMMGDGFAVIPSDGEISAPIAGKIVNVFPTQHAVGFQSGNLEVLLHMGIDTVSLNGGPFNTVVSEGQAVTDQTLVSQVDLAQLEAEGKDNAMIVIFTNGNDTIATYEIIASGNVTRGQEIGKLILK